MIVHQKRRVGSSWQWKELDLFSEDPFRSVTACTWKCTLMADDYISISFVSREYVTFAVGDWCIINGRFYSIRSMADINRKAESMWEYNIVMYGVTYELIKCLFRNCDMYGRSSTCYFDLTYTLEEFVKVIVYNMNRDAAEGAEEWEWGNDSSFPFPATDPLTINFQRTNCLAALQDICKKFDYEFRITQRWENDRCIKTITVGQFSKTPQNTTPFAYGMGEGLYQLKECKVDDSTIVTRLWVEGGQENVRSSYRNYAQFLQLPLRRWNRYNHHFDDGSDVFPHSEIIGITDDNKRYIEDASLIERYGVIEDSFQTDEIYPHFIGTIHSIGSSWSGGNGRLQFRAVEEGQSEFPFDLNAKWAKQDTPNFQSDYTEWCYINGYYSDNLDDYERFCLIHGYTDEYHQYLNEHGYTESQLPFAGWEELIMNGLIVPIPQTYTAFEQECGNALNAYNSIANSNGTKYLVDSSTCAKIAFITGKLSGQTFDVNGFTLKTIGGKKYGQFTINERQEQDTGTVMPSPDDTPGQPFRFAAGDKFKIIDIFLPYEYYIKAEEELWYVGKEKFEDVKQASYRYDLTFERDYILEYEDDLLALIPGHYIKIFDERFFSETTNHTKNLRISGIDIDLLKYNNFKLTLDSVHKLKRRHIGNNIFDIDDIINQRYYRAAELDWGGRDFLNPGHSTTPGNVRRDVFGGGSVIRQDIIADNTIVERMLASDSVTSSKIKNGAIPQSKLNTDLSAKINASAERSAQIRWYRELVNDGATADRHYSGEINYADGKLLLKAVTITDRLSRRLLGHKVPNWSNPNEVEVDFSAQDYEAAQEYSVFAELIEGEPIIYHTIKKEEEAIAPDNYLKIGEVSADNGDGRVFSPFIGQTYIDNGVIKDSDDNAILDIKNGILRGLLKFDGLTKVEGGITVNTDLISLLGASADSGLRKQVSDKLNSSDIELTTTAGGGKIRLGQNEFSMKVEDVNGVKRLVIGNDGISFDSEGKISIKNAQGQYVTLFSGAKINNGTITIGGQSITPTSDSSLFVHTNDRAWTQLVSRMNTLVNAFDGKSVNVCDKQQAVCTDVEINFGTLSTQNS